MPFTPKSPGAIIVGGGVGGLCAAIALRRAGIEATVYERAAMLGDVGAGLVVWTNAMRVLRELGIADAVLRDGSAIEHGQIRTKDGEVLAASEPGELETTFGIPTVAIHRAALHGALLSALPDDAVQLASACTSISQDAHGVTASFADGREVRGDFLVGADGIRSVVRRHLFPDVALRYSGYMAWRGAVMTRDEAALGLTSESWGRGNRFGISRLDRERVYWFATANTEAGKSFGPVECRARLLEVFGDWHHPIPHLLETTPDDAILQNDIHDIPPMKRWSMGRITLLGDAAHATTPNLGQGACMAIESAFVLAGCVAAAAKDIPAALARYETLRRPRTAWITQQSRQIGRVGQWEHPLACRLRNFVVKAMPDRSMKSRLAKVVGGGPA